MKINEILTFKKEYEEVTKKGEYILCPDICNIDKIGCIYNDVITLYKTMGKKYTERQITIAMIALLYSPRTYIGKSLERGIRDEIARIIGSSTSNISNTLTNVVSWYGIYSDFRETINDIYNNIDINKYK